MNHTIALIGVPSSAGAHWPGQEKAPQYLRDAGLVAGLQAVSLDVVDYGDLPLVRFRPDMEHRRSQNLAAVVELARRVAVEVDGALERDATPLVIGGDCTIGLGVVAGYVRRHEDLALIYFDGHVDLNTPATTASGILDSMGVAHMIGAPGAADELTHIGSRFPLLDAENVVLFGYNPREMTADEETALARRRLPGYPLPEVQGRAAEAAREALKYVEERAQRFVAHFDVDVIDFTGFPMADVPQFSPGLPYRDAMACLAAFVSSPKFGGLTVTEFNPDHADEDGALAATFIQGLAGALVGKEVADT